MLFKEKMRILLALSTLLIFTFVFTSCASDEEKQKQMEQEAKDLYAKGRQLVAIGKTFEGFDIYEKIAEDYPDTKVAADIIAAMEAKGYTLSNFRVSYTAQQMIKFENRVIEFIRRNGRYPRAGEIRSPMDAWGNPITFVLREKSPSHDFLIMSKGADKIANSEDDSIIVHQRDATLFQHAKEKASSAGYKKKSRGAYQKAGGQNGGLDQTEAMLKQLQNAPSATDGSSRAMDMNDIESMMETESKLPAGNKKRQRDAQGLDEIQKMMGGDSPSAASSSTNADDDFNKFMQQQ